MFTCTFKPTPTDNRVEINNSLLARRQSNLKKYADYGEIAKNIKTSMGEQGNLSDAMADYLSSRMDGDALDHTNGKQLLLHACKP